MITLKALSNGKEITKFETVAIFGNRTLFVYDTVATNETTKKSYPALAMYEVRKHEENEMVNSNEIKDKEPGIMLIFSDLRGLDILRKRLNEVRKQFTTKKQKVQVFEEKEPTTDSLPF